MVEMQDLAEIRRSIRSAETRLSAEVSALRSELFDLQSRQQRAESRAEHNALLTDMRNNFRWMMAAIVMFAVVTIFTIIVGIVR
jgi:hypothetical protein